MIIDLCLYEEGTIPGVSIVINLDKVSIGHMSRVDLIVAQQFFYFLQVGYYIPTNKLIIVMYLCTLRIKVELTDKILEQYFGKNETLGCV